MGQARAKKQIAMGSVLPRHRKGGFELSNYDRVLIGYAINRAGTLSERRTAARAQQFLGRDKSDLS